MAKQSQRKSRIRAPLHRFTAPEKFTFARANPTGKDRKLVSILAKNLLLEEAGTGSFALLMGLRRLVQHGSDAQMLALMRFLHGLEASQQEAAQREARAPFPSIFVSQKQRHDEEKTAVEQPRDAANAGKRLDHWIDEYASVSRPS